MKKTNAKTKPDTSALTGLARTRKRRASNTMNKQASPDPQKEISEMRKVLAGAEVDHAPVTISLVPDMLVGQGRQTAATYIKQEIPAYQSNPFIEALPAIMTEDEVIEALARDPAYDEKERRLPTHLRLHAIQSALECFVPLPVHLDLEQRFSRMIRAGYQRRNPTARLFWRDLESDCANLPKSTSVVPNSAQRLCLGFTIIGFPGVGKSTSVEAILSLYPQVIYHTRYAKRDFHVAQVVWLKLECPFDGSIKGLCLNFFQTMDQLLGTHYEQNYAGGRKSTDDLLPKMARVAVIHGIGVLVIDEINRLSGNKSGGATKMLSFFVQMTNSMGIPIVLVGTFKPKKILSGEFHQIRRGTGQGDLVWDRMEEGQWVTDDKKKGSAQPGVWQLLLESFWIYQYTAVPCPLTKELSQVLYDETQGITDFAAKIYVLAQIRTIVTADNPKAEILTADIIRSVARDSLKQAQPVLSALRRNDTHFLSTVPDINPIDLDEFILKEAGKLKNRRATGNDASAEDPGASAVPVTTPYGETPSQNQAKPARPKAKRRKKGEMAVYDEGDLRAGFSSGKEEITPGLEALQKGGHIGSAMDYLNEKGVA